MKVSFNLLTDCSIRCGTGKVAFLIAGSFNQDVSISGFCLGLYRIVSCGRINLVDITVVCLQSL